MNTSYFNSTDYLFNIFKIVEIRFSETLSEKAEGQLCCYNCSWVCFFCLHANRLNDIYCFLNIPTNIDIELKA